MTRTAGELAEYLGAALSGDALVPVSGVASPERARAEDLIYAASPKHHSQAAASAARCVIATPGTRLRGKTILESGDPKLAFAKAADWLLPKPSREAGIHRTAIISPSAVIAASASVGPYAVIEDDVEIAAGSRIGALCFLGRGARVGENCTLQPRVNPLGNGHWLGRVRLRLRRRSPLEISAARPGSNRRRCGNWRKHGH